MSIYELNKKQEEAILERQLLRKMQERIVKTFLDTIVLAKLRARDEPMSGYDVIALIHEKFGILVSSGTVYSHLYFMERDGLIKGRLSQRKRVYMVTDKGENEIETIFKTKEKILGLILNLFI